VFDTLHTVYSSVSNQDEAMAKAMMMSWVNFAKNGNPSVDGFPQFLPINQNPQQLLHFAMDGIRFENDPFEKRLNFISSLFSKNHQTPKQDTLIKKDLPKYPTR